MESVYKQAMNFKKKYPMTICHHRLKKHARVIEEHLVPGEVVNYAFVAQKNAKWNEFFETCIVAITNERLLIGQKRVLFGYFLNSVTPDLYNDMQVRSNILWGNVTIDTAKEKIELSNIDKKALSEIQEEISTFMLEAKKDYDGDPDNNRN